LQDRNRASSSCVVSIPNAVCRSGQLALLKSEVIDPLRQLEIELGAKAPGENSATMARAPFGDGDAPGPLSEDD